MTTTHRTIGRTRRRNGLFTAALALLVLTGCTGGVDVEDSADGDASASTQVDSGVDVGDGAQQAALAAGDLRPLSGCVVRASAIDLTPVWNGQQVGAVIAVSRDGVEIFRTDPISAEDGAQGAFGDVGVEVGATYAYSVQAVADDGTMSEPTSCGSGQLLAPETELSCGVRLSDAGLPEITWDAGLVVQSIAILRDGVEIATGVGSPFVDEGAPIGQAAVYSVVATDTSDQGRAPVTVECGDVTADIQQASSVDLAVAVDRSLTYLSPFQYVTLTPVCPGCTGTVELYLVPSITDSAIHEVDQVWVNGAPSADRSPNYMVDPLTVASMLVEAEANGQAVVYEVDQATGLVKSWTIDGVGARYQCLEIDTRAIDMRSTRCELNLFIG